MKYAQYIKYKAHFISMMFEVYRLDIEALLNLIEEIDYMSYERNF